jgi:hypothetical protein
MTRETIIGGGEWRFDDLRDLEPAAPGSPSDPTTYLLGRTDISFN